MNVLNTYLDMGYVGLLTSTWSICQDFFGSGLYVQCVLAVVRESRRLETIWIPNHLTWFPNQSLERKNGANQNWGQETGGNQSRRVGSSRL
eukprot:334328-Amphidinium_carterae.1